MVQAGWQARRSPLPLLEYRQHSRYQTNIQLGSFGELQFYKNLSKEITLELERSQSQLQQIQSQLSQTQIELERSQNMIKAMESSKFWKIRQYWFRIKELLGIKSKINEQI
jgi:hypothetical protein